MVDALEATEWLDIFCISQIGGRGNEMALSAACGVCSRPFVAPPVSGRSLAREGRCGVGPEPVLVDLVMFDEG
jgi:hypothetical protein